MALAGSLPLLAPAPGGGTRRATGAAALGLLLAACGAGGTPTGGPEDTAPGEDSAPVDPCAPAATHTDGVVSAAPIPVDSDLPHLTDGVVVGDTLVLAGQDVGFQAALWSFDISRPEAPALLGSDGERQIMGVCWSGDRGFAIELHGGVRSYTLDSRVPVLGDTVAEGNGGARIDCDETWVAWGRGSEGGGVARVTDGDLDAYWLGGHVTDALLEGDRLWTIGYDGLHAYDLSSGAPVRTGSLALDAACTDLAAHEAMLVAACGASGVVLVDRAEGVPEALGGWVGHVLPRSVAVSGDTVVVSGWTEWVLLDVTDPAAPVQVGAETAPTAASAVVPHTDAQVFLVDWKRPTVATLAPADAPEARIDAGYVRPGDVVRVENDGTDWLCLGAPSGGSLDRTSVAPGEAAAWTIPGDAAEGTVLTLSSDDADEPELGVEVGSLQGFVVGDPAPPFVETDIEGGSWSLEELQGTVVFLGLLDSW